MVRAMLFDLRRISTRTLLNGPWTPMLEITDRRVALVRRRPIGGVVDAFPREQLVTARVVPAERALDKSIHTFAFVEERAIVEATGERGDELVLLLIFDDGTNRAAWAMQGAKEEMEEVERIARTRVDADTGELPVARLVPKDDHSDLTRVRLLLGAGGLLGLLGLLFIAVSAIDGGGRTVVTSQSGAVNPPAGEQADGQATSTSAAPSPPSPLSVGVLTRAAADLTRVLGRQPELSRLAAGTRRATFDLVSADGRQLERWVWFDGQLSGPRALAATPERASLWSLAQVRLARVPAVVRGARLRTGGGDPVVTIRRVLPPKRTLLIRIDTTATTGSTTTWATSRGRLLPR